MTAARATAAHNPEARTPAAHPEPTLHNAFPVRTCKRPLKNASSKHAKPVDVTATMPETARAIQMIAAT